MVMLLHAISMSNLYCANKRVCNENSSSNGFFVIPLLLWSSRCPSGPHGFQERLAASQEAMKNKNVVNLGAIRQGMKRFQFLLNCCEPGTIPDASILAAALDLVRFTLEKIMKQE